MSEQLRRLTDFTSACSTWDQLPAGTRVSVRGTVIWDVKNPKLVVPSDCLRELARIGAELSWWRLRITGNVRTKYHKHRS